MTRTSHRLAVAASVLAVICGVSFGQEKKDSSDIKTLQQRALDALKAAKAGDAARQEGDKDGAVPAAPPAAPSAPAPKPAPKSDLPSFSEVAPRPASPKEEPKPGPKPLPPRETK